MSVFTKLGMDVFHLSKQVAKGSVRGLKEHERRGLDGLVPFRFTAAGTGAIIAGTVAANTASSGLDISTYNQARTIGDLSVSTLANQVGVSKANYNSKFVREIPDDISRTATDVVVGRKAMSENSPARFYDSNAGGDLVLALHNLR